MFMLPVTVPARERERDWLIQSPGTWVEIPRKGNWIGSSLNQLACPENVVTVFKYACQGVRVCVDQFHNNRKIVLCVRPY